MFKLEFSNKPGVLHIGWKCLRIIIDGAFATQKELPRSFLQSGVERGTPIRLESCNTGAFDDGAAYQLSGYMKSPVMAPTNKIRVLDGGAYEVFGVGTFRVLINR